MEIIYWAQHMSHLNSLYTLRLSHAGLPDLVLIDFIVNQEDGKGLQDDLSKRDANIASLQELQHLDDALMLSDKVFDGGIVS